MLASEALYDGAPLAHCVAYEERNRLNRLNRSFRASVERRKNGRHNRP